MAKEKSAWGGPRQATGDKPIGRPKKPGKKITATLSVSPDIEAWFRSFPKGEKSAVMEAILRRSAAFKDFKDFKARLANLESL